MSLAGGNIFALGFRGEDGNFSLRIGGIGSGTAEINNRDIDQNSALSLGAAYDGAISDHVFWGISADFHRIDWNNPRTGESDKGTMIDIAGGLRYRIAISDGLFALRPGISLGTGILSSTLGLGNSRFFTLKSTVELTYYFSDQMGLLLEGGLFVAPSGDDNVNDVSIHSLPIIRVGLVF